MASSGVKASGRRVPGIGGVQLLVALFGGAAAWTAHLFASYVIVALWCSTSWSGIGVMIGLVTLICTIGALVSTWISWRSWRRGEEALRTDTEPGVPEGWDSRLGERGARAAFLALLGLFLNVLFAYLIVLEGVPAILSHSCYAWTTG